jgi:hypothetical protein
VHVLNLSDITIKFRGEAMFVTADLKSSIHIMHVCVCVCLVVCVCVCVWVCGFISPPDFTCLTPLVSLPTKYHGPGCGGSSPYEI